MTKIALFVALLATLFSILPALAGSSSGSDTVTFGDLTTSNWRSDDFKGSSYREWDSTGSSFLFKWNTAAGDQIGRLGTTYGSNLLGPKLSEIAPDCIMSTQATFTPATSHWFFWSIYGWTNPTYTYWSNTPKGWNTEFYIICHTDEPKSWFDSDKELVPVGSVDVDGVTFDCYHTPRPVGAQWWAVRRAKTWDPSVNLKKIFDFWRSKGLADEYVVDMGWAVEGFTGSAGTLKLTGIVIPNLKTGVPNALK
jgi:hypothetical protein